MMRALYNECQSYVNISGKYIELGEYSKAKEYLDMAVEQYNSKYLRLARVNIIAAYVIVYHRMGEDELAYTEASKVLKNDRETYFEIESYIDYTDISGILIEMGYTAEAERLLNIMEEVCEKEYSNIRRKELCIRYVELYKKLNNTVQLNHWYEEYYIVSRKMYDESKEVIVTSIDNRQKLETEREINAELTEDNNELAKESEYDELTSLNNRYGLTRDYDMLNEEAVRNGYNMCVAIFDIDYFKIYNDTYGHLAGDECLVRIAQILKRNVKDDYCAVRYGGDEFIVMGINKTDDEVNSFAKHLLSDIADADMKFEAHPFSDRVTISFGAVNIQAGKDYDISEFIHSADNALYKVKQNGKNSYYVSDSL